MSEIVLRIPVPPSANRIWRRAGAIMHKSTEYRAWKDAAAAAIQEQRAGRCFDWFSIGIDLPHSRRDPDNSIKPILDACQAGGAVINDSRLRGMTLDVLDEPGEVVTVRLYEAAPRVEPKRSRKRAA
jgi:Holliday junction resolvase RusA-like endonuclease